MPWCAARPARTSTPSPRPPALPPGSDPPAGHPGHPRRRARRRRGTVVRPAQVAAMARMQRLRAGLRPQLRGRRPRHRSARPDRGTRERRCGAPDGPEADHGPEPPDPEVTGSAARRADQGAALRAHRGGRRAPAAGPARPARRHRAAAARPGRARTPSRLRPRWRPSLPAARGSAAPAWHPARSASPSGCPACSTPPSGRPAGSRTTTCPSSTCSSRCSRRARPPRPGRLLGQEGLTRDSFLSRADQDPRQPAGDLGDARGAPTRRWRSTAATWSRTPPPAGWTRSSAGTARSGG